MISEVYYFIISTPLFQIRGKDTNYILNRKEKS